MGEQAAQDRLKALKPRLRIDFGQGIRLGPGKIDLLEAIAATGSISGAGRRIGMSYRRSWLLVEELNGLFLEPVVRTSAGGVHGGGTEITPFGQALMAAFRRIEAQSAEAIAREFAPFADKITPVEGQARRP